MRSAVIGAVTALAAVTCPTAIAQDDWSDLRQMTGLPFSCVGPALAGDGLSLRAGMELPPISYDLPPQDAQYLRAFVSDIGGECSPYDALDAGMVYNLALEQVCPLAPPLHQRANEIGLTHYQALREFAYASKAYGFVASLLDWADRTDISLREAYNRRDLPNPAQVFEQIECNRQGKDRAYQALGLHQAARDRAKEAFDSAARDVDVLLADLEAMTVEGQRREAAEALRRERYAPRP